MAQDLKTILSRFHSGVDVAMEGDLPDKLLGVQDGFQRYFHDALERPVPVTVAPQRLDPGEKSLPLSDSDILALARERALALQEQLENRFDFYVGTEAGVLTFGSGGEERHFVRNWTVILGFSDEAWGSSGSVQLPERLIEGLDEEQVPFAIPGTRRGGGMVSSLTGGLETRRSATCLATSHALSTLLYGVLGHRPRPQGVRRTPPKRRREVSDS